MNHAGKARRLPSAGSCVVVRRFDWTPGDWRTPALNPRDPGRRSLRSLCPGLPLTQNFVPPYRDQVCPTVMSVGCGRTLWVGSRAMPSEARLPSGPDGGI